MPRKATGAAYESRGKWYAKITIGPKVRVTLALPTCTTEAEADQRAGVLATAAAKLRGVAGVTRERLEKILEGAAGAAEGKDLAEIMRFVDRLATGAQYFRAPSPKANFGSAPVPPAVLEGVKDLIAREGEKAAMERLHVQRMTLYRIAAGLPVRRGTAEMVEARLASRTLRREVPARGSTRELMAALEAALCGLMAEVSPTSPVRVVLTLEAEPHG